MTDAPKRIWIECNPTTGIPPFPSWNDDEAHESALQIAEYLRADIADDLLEALEAAASEIEVAFVSLGFPPEMSATKRKIDAAIARAKE